MAIIQSAASTDLATVDPTMKSIHSVIKPDELVGSFHLGAASGLIAATAINSPLFSFRWAPGTGQFCAIRRISLGVMTTTGPTSAQLIGWNLLMARSWTASDSGGTALTPAAAVVSAGTNKSRGSLQNSVATDIRIATTGALTAGTRVLDTQPLNSQYAWIGATTAGVGTTLTNTNMIAYNSNDYPILLQNNEGFVITLALASVVMVHQIMVNVEWIEVNNY
jgi:hypothetical protein